MLQLQMREKRSALLRRSFSRAVEIKERRLDERRGSSGRSGCCPVLIASQRFKKEFSVGRFVATALSTKASERPGGRRAVEHSALHRDRCIGRASDVVLSDRQRCEPGPWGEHDSRQVPVRVKHEERSRVIDLD
jgi:hypothetical protein